MPAEVMSVRETLPEVTSQERSKSEDSSQQSVQVERKKRKKKVVTNAELVSREVKDKLELFINRERRENRWDPTGRGLIRTNHLMFKYDLAYRILETTELERVAKRKKKSQQEKSASENDDCQVNNMEDHPVKKLHAIHRYRPHTKIRNLPSYGKVQNYSRHVGAFLHTEHYVQYYLSEGLHTGNTREAQRLIRLSGLTKQVRSESDLPQIGDKNRRPSYDVHSSFPSSKSHHRKITPPTHQSQPSVIDQRMHSPRPPSCVSNHSERRSVKSYRYSSDESEKNSVHENEVGQDRVDVSEEHYVYESDDFEEEEDLEIAQVTKDYVTLSSATSSESLSDTDVQRMHEPEPQEDDSPSASASVHSESNDDDNLPTKDKCIEPLSDVTVTEEGSPGTNKRGTRPSRRLSSDLNKNDSNLRKTDDNLRPSICSSESQNKHEPLKNSKAEKFNDTVFDDKSYTVVDSSSETSKSIDKLSNSSSTHSEKSPAKRKKSSRSKNLRHKQESGGVHMEQLPPNNEGETKVKVRSNKKKEHSLCPEADTSSKKSEGQVKELKTGSPSFCNTADGSSSSDTFAQDRHGTSISKPHEVEHISSKRDENVSERSGRTLPKLDTVPTSRSSGKRDKSKHNTKSSTLEIEGTEVKNGKRLSKSSVGSDLSRPESRIDGSEVMSHRSERKSSRARLNSNSDFGSENNNDLNDADINSGDPRVKVLSSEHKEKRRKERKSSKSSISSSASSGSCRPQSQMGKYLTGPAEVDQENGCITTTDSPNHSNGKTASNKSNSIPIEDKSDNKAASTVPLVTDGQCQDEVGVQDRGGSRESSLKENGNMPPAKEESSNESLTKEQTMVDMPKYKGENISQSTHLDAEHNDTKPAQPDGNGEKKHDLSQDEKTQATVGQKYEGEDITSVSVDEINHVPKEEGVCEVEERSPSAEDEKPVEVDANNVSSLLICDGDCSSTNVTAKTNLELPDMKQDDVDEEKLSDDCLSLPSRAKSPEESSDMKPESEGVSREHNVVDTYALGEHSESNSVLEELPSVVQEGDKSRNQEDNTPVEMMKMNNADNIKAGTKIEETTEHGCNTNAKEVLLETRDMQSSNLNAGISIFMNVPFKTDADDNVKCQDKVVAGGITIINGSFDTSCSETKADKDNIKENGDADPAATNEDSRDASKKDGEDGMGAKLTVSHSSSVGCESNPADETPVLSEDKQTVDLTGGDFLSEHCIHEENHVESEPNILKDGTHNDDQPSAVTPDINFVATSVEDPNVVTIPPNVNRSEKEVIHMNTLSTDAVDGTIGEDSAATDERNTASVQLKNMHNEKTVASADQKNSDDLGNERLKDESSTPISTVNNEGKGEGLESNTAHPESKPAVKNHTVDLTPSTISLENASRNGDNNSKPRVDEPFSEGEKDAIENMVSIVSQNESGEVFSTNEEPNKEKMDVDANARDLSVEHTNVNDETHDDSARDKVGPQLEIQVENPQTNVLEGGNALAPGLQKIVSNNNENEVLNNGGNLQVSGNVEKGPESPSTVSVAGESQSLERERENSIHSVVESESTGPASGNIVTEEINDMSVAVCESMAPDTSTGLEAKDDKLQVAEESNLSPVKDKVSDGALQNIAGDKSDPVAVVGEIVVLNNSTVLEANDDKRKLIDGEDSKAQTGEGVTLDGSSKNVAGIDKGAAVGVMAEAFATNDEEHNSKKMKVEAKAGHGMADESDQPVQPTSVNEDTYDNTKRDEVDPKREIQVDDDQPNNASERCEDKAPDLEKVLVSNNEIKVLHDPDNMHISGSVEKGPESPNTVSIVGEESQSLEGEREHLDDLVVESEIPGPAPGNIATVQINNTSIVVDESVADTSSELESNGEKRQFVEEECSNMSTVEGNVSDSTLGNIAGDEGDPVPMVDKSSVPDNLTLSDDKRELVDGKGSSPQAVKDETLDRNSTNIAVGDKDEVVEYGVVSMDNSTGDANSVAPTVGSETTASADAGADLVVADESGSADNFTVVAAKDDKEPLAGEKNSDVPAVVGDMSLGASQNTADDEGNADTLAEQSLPADHSTTSVVEDDNGQTADRKKSDTPAVEGQMLDSGLKSIASDDIGHTTVVVDEDTTVDKSAVSDFKKDAGEGNSGLPYAGSEVLDRNLREGESAERGAMVEVSLGADDTAKLNFEDDNRQLANIEKV